MTSEGFNCVTLNWLYNSIEKRTRNADLNAYKKFYAARIIQGTYRGYKIRQQLIKQRESAIIIQKWWRSYSAGKKYYDLVEDILNKRIIDWYDYNATIIQKWWRGYITRLLVHDHRKLRETQKQAAKDLIICIAYKLHHLLRTRTIPGVYSLRNTKALSKVEELLASLKFKEYNDAMRKIRAEKAKMAADTTYKSKISKLKTKVPYGPLCQKETKVEDMFSVLDREHDNPRDNVIKSMKRWKIVKDDNATTIPPQIVQKPQNIENFIGEIESICYQQNLIPQPSTACIPETS